MNVALLFDERPSPYRGYVPHLVLDRVFSAGVLQASERLLVVRTGSLLFHMFKDPHAVAERALFSDLWRRGDSSRLRTAYRETMIFGWHVANMTPDLAACLHEKLVEDPLYLGMHVVDLARKEHWALYRCFLSLQYRVQGRRCWLFYSAVEALPEFDTDAQDWETFACLKDAGFDEVGWEDLGLRGSIWDDLDTPDHFKRLDSLRRLLSVSLGRAERADELIVLLEDLNPRLCATLGTAARSCLAATSKEDLAQAATSARRYVVQLADAVFPARATPVNGRQVTRDKVKNRLGAYVEESLRESPDVNAHERLEALGKEVSRLYGEVSTLLHGSPSESRVRAAIGDLATLSVQLLLLVPERNRDPLSPYAETLVRRLRDSVGKGDMS